MITTLKYINKIREYCDYVEEHLNNIAKAWTLVQESCEDMIFISDEFLFTVIDELVNDHDLSKVSHEEFIPYVRNFFPVGEADNELFAAAWKNHQDCNPHHWQNWTQKEDEYDDEWKCHAVCMVIDWIAMGTKFDDNAQEYFEKNQDSIKISDEAVEFIYEIFERVYQ